jgi:putative metalloprotease
MKTKTILLIVVVTLFCSYSHAQINLGERATGALGNLMSSFTFSNEDAANLAKGAIKKMDSASVVAGPKDAYLLRLNKIFGKHKTENGLSLNYKVYKTKEVNAFACADGSVRVYAGLMDIMDDNELLAVIGHEIGHVANEDTKDAMKAAYRKAALIDGVASQSDKVAAVSDGQLGKIASAMVDSKHSRSQERDADTFSYDFMKRNGYNVNAVESAFNILANLSGGAGSDFLSKMMSSHPDPKERADLAKSRAEKDGLYKPYVKFTVKSAPSKAGGAKKKKK